MLHGLSGRSSLTLKRRAGYLLGVLRKLRTPAIVFAVLLALYAFAGFVVLPAAARAYAMDYLRETYGHELAIGKLRFNPFTLRLRIENLTLDTAQRDRLLSFSLLDANVGWRSLAERALVLQALVLNQPFVHVHLRQDGSLNLVAAFADDQAEEPQPQEESGGLLPVVVDDFVLDGGAVRFTDNSGGRDFDRRFEPLDLHVRDFATQPREPSELISLLIRFGEQGQLAISGAFSADPLVFDLGVHGERIPLAMVQPYVPETLAAKIAEGSLSLDLRVAHALAGQASALGVLGTAAIDDLEVNVAGRDEPVLSWNALNLRGIDLALTPHRLVIEEVVFDGLDSAFRIYGDGDTNIGVVLRGGAAADAAESGAESASGEHADTGGASGADEFPFSIGRVAFVDSKLLYNDQQIVPHVAVSIEDFAGEITGISSEPDARIKAAFDGRVGRHGSAAIDGGLLLSTPKDDLDAKVSFGNVELTDFSPYSGKFAGYVIDKGKLFLDLRYTLQNGRIVGQNHAVFDQFELGRRVDSKDATGLPVKFALSLLRDRHGRIDISLPVEGDVNAPGFRFGHLIGQALLNVLTKIVTAPFTFLAGLFGGGPEMEYAQFEAGSGAVDVAEREKIQPLARAFEERPQLMLEIQGWAEKAADGDALRQQKLDALLAAQAEAGVAAESALAGAYDAWFGAGAAQAVRTELRAAAEQATAGEEGAAAETPDAEDGSRPQTPDERIEATLKDELRQRLLAAQTVTDEELIGLAYLRGQGVMDVLVEAGVTADRVFVRRGEIAREGTRAKLILGSR